MTIEEAREVLEDELQQTQYIVDMKESGQLPLFELDRDREWSTALKIAIEALKLSALAEKVCVDTEDFSVPEKHSHCIRCGRLLKNPDAQLRGYGEVCWKKTQLDKQTKLF